MFELPLLIILIAVVVFAMRGGKRVKLDNPLVIDRAGEFHITLAPQLDRAQSFIEHVVRGLEQSGKPAGDVPTQFFEVRDPALIAQSESCYLLAACWRGGTWYFQAIHPQPLLSSKDSHLDNLRAFSEAVLLHHPQVEPVDERYVKLLQNVVENAALSLKIDARILQ